MLCSNWTKCPNVIYRNVAYTHCTLISIGIFLCAAQPRPWWYFNFIIICYVLCKAETALDNIRNPWASSNRIKTAKHDCYHKHSTVKSMEDLFGTCWFPNFCRTISTHCDHQIYYFLTKTKHYTVKSDRGIGLFFDIVCFHNRGNFSVKDLIEVTIKWPGTLRVCQKEIPPCWPGQQLSI